MTTLASHSTREKQQLASLWPSESANLVALQWRAVPPNVGAPTAQRCKLLYDHTHHYIRIVDLRTNNILDTIDVYDIVGASVEIDMNETMTTLDPRVASNVAADSTTNEPSSDSAPMDTQAHAKLTIYVYPRKPPNSSKSMISSIYHSCCNAALSSKNALLQPTPNYVRPSNFKKYSSRYAHHRSMVVDPVEDLLHVRAVVFAIQKLAHYYPHTPPISASTEIVPPTENTKSYVKHYVIICNPRSGPHRNAVEIAEQHVIPMLTQANIETTLCVTTHPGHAVELCHLRDVDDEPSSAVSSASTPANASMQQHLIQRLESDISYYNGIVVMGGDGTLHEVIQGIRSRKDAETILQTVPIGIIGCGTANGLATSLSYTSFLYGLPESETATNRPYDFSYKGVVDDTFAIAKGHTIFADISTYSILLESSNIVDQHTQIVEPVVQTGPPLAETQMNQSRCKQYTSFLTFTYGIIAEIDIESELIYWMGDTRFDVWAVWRVLFLRKYPVTLSYTTDPITSDTVMPSVTDPIPSSWITINDRIVLFWASHVSHASMKVFHSPLSKMADGFITILLVRGNVSRYRLAMILLALESGSHVDMPGAEWIKCTAYRLDPVKGNNIRETYNNVDGERVEPGPIQGCVHPRAIRYFISPPNKVPPPL